MEGVLEAAFLIGFLYWICPSFFYEGVSRINKMVDIVTNRMFDAFNRLAPRESHQNDSLASIRHLKRFSDDQKQRKTLTREAEIKARDSLLFDIKENAPPVAQLKRRPLMGLSCISCTPESRESLVNAATKNLPLKNVLSWTPAQSSNYGLVHKVFSHLSQVYELKKFDYPQVAGTVLRDERLKRAIKKTASEQLADNESNDDEVYQTLLKNNEKRAKKLLYDMRSTLSDFLLRFTSWVLYKLLPCFLSSVVIPSGHVEMLKNAGKTGLPLIFMPLHRSHLDYILISFILLNNNVRSPLVAAGDNLRIPFFGSLLRGLGAFFIKRRIDPIMGRKDHVYKAVLHTYMNECLRAGHNIEFFLEGGRTRTGKPCMPKYGILSVIVNAFMDGTIEDALLVPVGINYERLVDGNFTREQLGQAKEMETFSGAIKGIWHVLNSNYGMMRIDFNQPFSLRELVKTFNTNGKVPNPTTNRMLKSNPSTTSLYGTDVVSDEHKNLVENISKHVLYDCAQTTAVMSTNAVAFLLLNRFRNGTTIDKLVDALDELRTELTNGRKDLGFTGDSFDVITYAVDLLGPALVHRERVNNEEMIKPVSMLPNVIELAYYSNTLMSYFAMDAIIATALYSLNAVTSGRVVQHELVNTCMELCDILQYEFVFCKPCQNLESFIWDCVEELNIRQEIFAPQKDDDYNTQRSKRIASQFDDDSDEEQAVVPEYILNITEACVGHLHFLQGLFVPIVEAYSSTVFCLHKLVGRQLLENEFVTLVLEEMKRQISVGSLLYDESVSVDPVKNAMKYYQKIDVLECHQEKKLRLYYLKENYDSSENVSLLYGKIIKYRRD